MADLLVVKAGAALVVGFLIYRACFRRAPGASLPPGPKPLPVIGNVMDFPPKGEPEFRHWLKHKDTYGHISSVSVMGKTLVILHDKQAAEDLLERNSKKSSGRPDSEFANKLCGYGELLACQQDDDTFRRSRKLVHQQLGTNAALARFSDTQELETRRYLLRTLDEPYTLIQQLKVTAGAIILKMTYGYSIETKKADPLIDLIELNMANFPLAMVPLTWAVDIIPALKYLPDGFPGATFKETSRRWREINQAVVDVPYSFVRQQMATSSHQPSFVSNLIQQTQNGEDVTEESKLSHHEHDIKWTAAVMYGGGSASMVAQLTSFILAMIMFPEVQAKAQEEIDRTIGTDRLPQLADRGQLPYVEGVVKEVFRWFTVTPLGAPHVMSEDTIYKDYLIPTGAIILPAVWWFLHDPEVYVNPDSFDPERYLEPRSELDPKPVVFGYGRRTCPGRHLADSSIFLTIVQTLATFNIGKAIDEEGNEIDVKLEGIVGLVDCPKEFPYKIVPRSANHADLVRSIEAEHPWEGSDAGFLDKSIFYL